MSRQRTIRRGDAVVNLVVALVVVFVLVMVGGYAMGWIKFYSHPDKATVEFETREMQDAAKRAADDANRGLNKIGEGTKEVIRDADKAIHNATDDDTPNDSDVKPLPPVLPPTILPDPILPIPVVPPATEPVPSVPPAVTNNTAGPPVAPEVIPDIPRR